jgi:CheY-like chemotaxis protein
MKTVNILLVEDDDGDAKAIQRALHKANMIHPIIRAVDGIEALDILQGNIPKLKKREPYLMLVDLKMPRMSGIELLQTIRVDEKLKQSIVFMLTTSKRDDDKIAAYNLNVAGYILKECVSENFMKLANLIDSYSQIVEFPSPG